MPKTPVASLSLSPTQVTSEQTAVLNWQTQFATTVTLNGQLVGKVGSMSIVGLDQGVYTYTLFAHSKWGTATVSQVLTVLGETTPPVPTATLNVSPTVIFEDESATLAWTTDDATSVVINNNPVAMDGNMVLSGFSIGADTDFIYTLFATGPGGTVSKEAVLRVNKRPVPAPTGTFNISPNIINEGENATATWTTQNATAVDINGAALDLNGSATLTNVPGEHTYTLTASGPGGIFQAVQTLTVVAVLPSATLSLNPPTIFEGESSTLSWETENVSTVTINNQVVSVDGSMVVSPVAGAHIYTLVGSGTSGTITRTITLTVNVKPPVPTSKLLTMSNLEFMGSFRFPYVPYPDIANYAYGGTALTYNPANDSLFAVGHDWYQMVGEFKIPALIKGSNINELNYATAIQGLSPVTNRIPNITIGGTQKIGGTLVHNDKLICTLYEYYDADANSIESHFTINPKTNIASGTVEGLFRVDNFAGGQLAGYMGHVPPSWQERLGCKYLAGLHGVPIVSRTSAGPALFGFDPDDWTFGTKLLFYPFYHGGSHPDDHPLVEPWSSTNSLWNPTSFAHNVIFPNNTDTVLFIGTIGIGQVWYGSNGDYPELDDPCVGSKGYHAFPYVAQMWAYDANDLLKVKNGEMESWAVKPYTYWQFTLPFESCQKSIWSACLDDVNDRIFINQAHGGPWGEPVIHVYKINK